LMSEIIQFFSWNSDSSLVRMPETLRLRNLLSEFYAG
jgi:hypothetical protein